MAVDGACRGRSHESRIVADAEPDPAAGARQDPFDRVDEGKFIKRRGRAHIGPFCHRSARGSSIDFMRRQVQRTEMGSTGAQIVQTELRALALTEDPIRSFMAWLEEAKRAGAAEPTAMTLATATPQGRPSARIVLFKGMSEGESGRSVGSAEETAPVRLGLNFFTHFKSRKSEELQANPQAALVFHWPVMGRQVRFEGVVERLAAADSNAYFQVRPRASRIGAWASPQSKIIASREELENRVKEVASRFGDGEVPCPPFWGGWRLVPNQIEFWQAGESRLHDRFVYEWGAAGWAIARLAP